jgi:hypothetical protein
VIYKPCTVQILKQCAKHTERTYTLELDVQSVGRTLVLDSTRVCFSLAVFLGIIRHRITVACIRYNRDSLVGRFARVRKVSKHLHPFS